VSLPVVILAGGLATRLRPLTERIPKILIDIAGRPFAEHQLELLRRAAISDVVYCLGYLGEQVADALADGSRWGMRFTYVFDGPRPLGTGGALMRALPHLTNMASPQGDPFFVMYGDSYLECDMSAVERSFRSSGKSGLMTVFRNENQWDRSNVTFDRGRIVRYNKAADATMHHIDYGLGVLTPEAFAPWAGTEEAFDLALVYQRLIDGNALAGFEVERRFYEIGSLEGLEELRVKLQAGTGTAQ
jgi:MurNAc alpha-1-phosphate uridylyltransferase